jgi:choline dehydrogenase-like flavoprotein
MCARLADNEAFRGIVTQRTSPTDEELSSDDALDDWLMKSVGTARHVSVTCRMGPAADSMAVVDQYCSVHGLEGLRVADASVLPEITRANTNAPAILIAERVSDWVK